MCTCYVMKFKEQILLLCYLVGQNERGNNMREEEMSLRETYNHAVV